MIREHSHCRHTCTALLLHVAFKLILQPSLPWYTAGQAACMPESRALSTGCVASFRLCVLALSRAQVSCMHHKLRGGTDYSQDCCTYPQHEGPGPQKCLLHARPILTRLLKTAVWCAVENVHEFEPRNISNTLHAFAKMNHNPGPALLEGLASEAARKAVNFNPQNLANTIWAFGTLGSPAAMDASVCHVLSMLRLFQRKGFG